MTGFDDQLTNLPTLVVHHKITGVADHSIARLDMVTVHGLYAAQMRIGTFVLAVGTLDVHTSSILIDNEVITARLTFEEDIGHLLTSRGNIASILF
jgi:hypothetical protein